MSSITQRWAGKAGCWQLGNSQNKVYWSISPLWVPCSLSASARREGRVSASPWLSAPSLPLPACKRKEQEPNKDRNNSQKKSRLVFTDLQRRTLFAIFKENKRPSKEMQITISQQLGLELTTVSNFFMNARRRSLEKWQDDLSTGGASSTSGTCTKAWRKDSQLGTSRLPTRTTDTQRKRRGKRHRILSWGPSLVIWKHNSLETFLF